MSYEGEMEKNREGSKDVGSLRQEDLDSQVSLGYVKLCLRRPEGGGAFEESSLFPLPVSHIQL